MALVLVNKSAFLRCDSFHVTPSSCITRPTSGLAVRAFASYCCVKWHSVFKFWIRVFVQFVFRSGAKRRKGWPMLLGGWKSYGTRPTLTQSKRYRHPFLDSGRTHVQPGYRHGEIESGPRADPSEQRLIWAVRISQPEIEEPIMNWRRGEKAERTKPIIAQIRHSQRQRRP
jgi:hypothetical protein